MNPPTQIKKWTRNTKKGSKKPHGYRVWEITINNHTEDNWQTLTNLKNNFEVKRQSMQEEKGESGTLHIQAGVQFENEILFKTLKRMFPTAHLNPARKPVALLRYCMKNETRYGRRFLIGMGKFTQEKKPKVTFWTDDKGIPLTKQMLYGKILDDMKRQMKEKKQS